VVPDVFLVLFSVDGLVGLVGCPGEVGERAGSDPVRTGRLGAAELEAVGAGLGLIDDGGGFLGDFERDRNMLSVVVARVSDRGWKARGMENARDTRASEEVAVGEEGENAEGDIGGLALLGMGWCWFRSEADIDDLMGLGSERSWGPRAVFMMRAS
jgi:hypothetical protein